MKINKAGRDQHTADWEALNEVFTMSGRAYISLAKSS